MAKFTKAKKVISAITAVSVLGTAVAASSFAVEKDIKQGDEPQTLQSILSVNVNTKFAEYTVSLSDFNTITKDPGEYFEVEGEFKVTGTASGNKGGVKLGEMTATSSDNAFSYIDQYPSGWITGRVSAPVYESSDFTWVTIRGQLEGNATPGIHDITVTANYSYDEDATVST